MHHPLVTYLRDIFMVKSPNMWRRKYKEERRNMEIANYTGLYPKMAEKEVNHFNSKKERKEALRLLDEPEPPKKVLETKSPKLKRK